MWEVNQHIQQRKIPAFIGEQIVEYDKKQESCSKQGKGWSKYTDFGDTETNLATVASSGKEPAKAGSLNVTSAPFFAA